MSGVLTGITELQGFTNSKLVVGKPVIVEDFNWGGVFVYKTGDLPAGTIGINSGINPGFHWVDLIGNFVVNYANNNLAFLGHTHDSTQITDLETWATGWLPLQTVDASQIANLVFPAAPVQSVNGQTGTVNLTAADVGAIATGSITVTTAEITDWASAFQTEFATLIVNASIDFSQITNIPLESPVDWADIESKPAFLLDFEALSISSLQGFLYHSGPDFWELKEALTIADITNLQTTLDGKQLSHPSLSALSTIGDNANTGYFKKTGLNSWQISSSVAWGELNSVPINLADIGNATLTGDGILKKASGMWAIAPQIDWGELANIPANLEEVAAIATAGYLKRATDGTIEAVEEVAKPPRPGTWGNIITYEVGDVPIIIVPEDLVVNQRYINFSTDEAINVNIYCGVGEPPDLTISPPRYSFILRPGKQITDDDFYHNGQAIWAATPSSTQILNIQIAPAAIDYTGAEDLSAYQLVSAKGQPNGYAGLDNNSKILQANLPAIAITDTYPVNSEIEMLALTAEIGDVAIRLDLSASFILQGPDPTLLSNWQELLSPGTVQSVNGQVGTVVINDISGNAGTTTTLATSRTISSSGDITWSVAFDGSADVDGVAEIASNAVTNFELADMASGTIKGAIALGDPQDLTATQVRTILNVADGATANSTDAFLLDRANHTGTQTASTILDFDTEVTNNPTVTANTAKITNATHTGEVVGDSVLTITDGVVDNAKLTDMPESTIKGRITTGTGNPEDLNATQVRSIINVADGSTANSTDAQLRDRATHTGTQPGTTVTFDNATSGLAAGNTQSALDELDSRLDNLIIGTDVQGFSVELDAIASSTSAADKLFYFTGLGTGTLIDFPAFGRSLVASTDKDVALGLLKSVKSDATGITGASEINNIVAINQANYDAIVTPDPNTIYNITDAPSLTLAGNTTISTFGGTLVDDADAATARATLGLTIGTNVQAYDAELSAIAGLTSVADRLPYFTGSGTAALTTFTAFGRSLVDDVDAPTARTTLGLGSMATQSAATVAITGGSISGITDLAIADGGTGASTEANARTNLGLGNVDNTSDLAKPISTATQTALDGKLGLTTGGNVTAITRFGIGPTSQNQFEFSNPVDINQAWGLGFHNWGTSYWGIYLPKGSNSFSFINASGVGGDLTLGTEVLKFTNNNAVFADKVAINSAINTNINLMVGGGLAVTGPALGVINQPILDASSGNGRLLIQDAKEWQIYTNNALRAKVQSNGLLKVGTGTLNPSQAGSLISATNQGTSTIVAKDSANNVEANMTAFSGGVVLGSFTNHNVIIRVGNTDRLVLNTSNQILYNNVDITPEEGTFTPSLVGSTTAGTTTYTRQTGYYRKIGKLVYVLIRLTWTSHTGTGNMRVSGLPFPTEGVAGTLQKLNVTSTTNLTVPTNTYPDCLMFSSSTVVHLIARTSTGGNVTQPYLAMDADVSNLAFSGFYTTD